MKWMVRLYSLILLAYTGWRTYDFMASQLPKTDLSFWLSLIFLFATEVGLLLWHETSLNHATTETQEQLANWMTWIDFFASTAAGIADMIIRQTMVVDYKIPPILVDFLIYGLPITMALNVAAVLVYISNDGEAQIKREKRQVQYEIYRQALADLRNAKVEIARDKKAQVYSDLRAEITGNIDKKYGTRTATATQPPVVEEKQGLLERLFRKPTEVVYNQETPAAVTAEVNKGERQDDAPTEILPEDGRARKSANPTSRRQS